jgi:hypothetical protein
MVSLSRVVNMQGFLQISHLNILTFIPPFNHGALKIQAHYFILFPALLCIDQMNSVTIPSIKDRRYNFGVIPERNND